MPTTALFSSSLHSFAAPRPHLPTPRRLPAAPVARRAANFFKTHIRASENGAGPAGAAAAAAAAVEEKEPKKTASQAEVASSTPPAVGAFEPAVNGAARVVEAAPVLFKDRRWVGGSWDLAQFEKDGRTDWDAVIDAEVRRRKWLEINPESTTNEEPVVFDTSIIPWWAWMKRFHLPEAELLNGRAAMVGFFMAYFVDSLTGVGLVDQMGNFFCKTLLFIAVVGVLLIRKNEDIEKLKKLIEETTLYDQQWQATWQDDPPSSKSED